jgi:hypothetical protein
METYQKMIFLYFGSKTIVVLLCCFSVLDFINYHKVILLLEEVIVHAGSACSGEGGIKIKIKLPQTMILHTLITKCVKYYNHCDFQLFWRKYQGREEKDFVKNCHLKLLFLFLFFRKSSTCRVNRIPTNKQMLP